MRWLMIILFPLSLVAQPPTDRYQTDLFSTWTETSGVQFSTDVPQPVPGGGFYEFLTGLPLNAREYETTDINLYMDIFEPTGDTLSQRPVVIICFGGGFLSGSRDYWSIRLLCQDLAKRGFVTAAIDYRLGMNIFDADLSQRAVYRGIQDARTAVRFFRADAAGANLYKVDPEKIFIGGHSAGAFMATHNAYLDKESERPISTYDWTQDGNDCLDQECLDCVGDNQDYSGHADGIFSLAGALGFTSYMESSDDLKMVMFHSEDDGTVPYDNGEPFGSILWLVVGSDLPDVYGSLPMSEEADDLGLPYEFYSYTDRGHGVHEDGTTALYDDIIPGIGDWFYAEELKPLYPRLLGDSIVCTGNLTQSYTLGAGTGTYFDWSVVGGSFEAMSTQDETATITWDASAPQRSVTVIPYSKQDAIGDTFSLVIETDIDGTNDWLGTSTTWEDDSNWSLNHTPTPCEDVSINVGTLDSLSLNSASIINSLQLGEMMNLSIQSGASLAVYQKDESNSTPAVQLQGTVTNHGTLLFTHKTSGLEMDMMGSEVLNFGDFYLGK